MQGVLNFYEPSSLPNLITATIGTGSLATGLLAHSVHQKHLSLALLTTGIACSALTYLDNPEKATQLLPSISVIMGLSSLASSISSFYQKNKNKSVLFLGAGATLIGAGMMGGKSISPVVLEQVEERQRNLIERIQESTKNFMNARIEDLGCFVKIIEPVIEKFESLDEEEQEIFNKTVMGFITLAGGAIVFVGRKIAKIGLSPFLGRCFTIPPFEI